VYQRWLRGSEFRLVPAASIRDAQRAIAFERPMAIVLDLMLDGEDSWNLLASLKNANETRQIPIIVLSAVEDAAKAFHLGADEYLMKPSSQDAMLNALRGLTGAVELPRVLIIDDDERDRYVLKHYLRGKRLIIIEASDGTEGIAKAISERPDLIFLDLSMPGVDGFEVLKVLDSDPRTHSIAVVIHTSKRLDPHEREALNAHASAILSKGEMDQETCIRTLASLLGDRGRVLR
jgi:CheY-like chemotaxis protein